jgi:alpha/beta superfamily hydrolase
VKQAIEFKSEGFRIAGNLYFPADLDPSREHAAIVVGGPLATVKEQAAGVFAEALAERGFVALAFDYRGYGESDGALRQYENPAYKTEDFQNAVSYMSAHHSVDSGRVGALGVCASSTYISAALRSDRRVKAFGTVSAHFSLREFFLSHPFATQEQIAQMYTASNTARQRYFDTGEAEPDDMIMPDMTEEPPAEYGQLASDVYDYYFARVAAEWPNYSNRMVPFSFEQLVRSHALDYADQITCPYLGVVGSEAVTRPLTERFIEAKSQGSAEMSVIDGA